MALGFRFRVFEQIPGWLHTIYFLNPTLTFLFNQLGLMDAGASGGLSFGLWDLWRVGFGPSEPLGLCFIIQLASLKASHPEMPEVGGDLKFRSFRARGFFSTLLVFGFSIESFRVSQL